MKSKKTLMVVAIAALAMIASACSIDVERNADGSLKATAVITESSLQAEMERDPQNESIDLDIQDGRIVVSGERINDAGTETNTIEFVADVALSGGELVVEVSDATFDGFPIPQPFVDVWNQALADGIARLSGHHPDATLESLVVGNDQIVTEWRVETRQSR